jgi:hypothetical protein
MRWLISGLAILLASMGSVPTEADDLPAAVQADVLKHQIADAIKANRDQDALASLDQYHQLERKGAQIPPLILFIEAQVAKRSGDSWRAYRALTAFLKIAHEGDPHYQDAIAMYSELGANPAVKAQIAARAEEERRRQQQSARAAAVSKAREQAEEEAEQQRQKEAADVAAQAQAAAATAARTQAITTARNRLAVLDSEIGKENKKCRDRDAAAYMSCIGGSDSTSKRCFAANQWGVPVGNGSEDRIFLSCERERACVLQQQYDSIRDSINWNDPPKPTASAWCDD